jgi:hypothetical protein
MSTGLLDMATIRADDTGGRKPKRKRRDTEPRPIALTIRGRQEWKGWVASLADFERISINELVDRALVRYAREVGYKTGAPER